MGKNIKKKMNGTSLVAQWLGVRLPMQGYAGLGPGPGASHMPQSGWAREAQLLSPRTWSPYSRAGQATAMRSPRTATESGPCSPQLKGACVQQQRPNTAKNK